MSLMKASRLMTDITEKIMGEEEEWESCRERCCRVLTDITHTHTHTHTQEEMEIFSGLWNRRQLKKKQENWRLLAA